MDTPATSRKRPASSSINAEARHLTANVGSISPPRVLRSATPRASGSSPPSLKLLYSQVQGLRGGIAAHEERSHHPQNRSYFSIEGGRNRERKCRIPRISPPLRFVLRLRLQKGGGGVFAGHYGNSILCSKSGRVCPRHEKL